MMNESKSAVIVLTRFPRPGRVKTDLATTLGEDVAAEFYRLCAERVFRESQRLPRPVRRYLFYDEAADQAQVRQWAGGDFRYEPQTAGDFGERVAAALRTVFRQGARKAVIVGSDVPDLSASLIEEALRLLDRYPLVIGPNHAGGYYLLGMKMLYADLFFRNLAWGTERVFGHTLRIMQGMELVPAFLPRLIDLVTEGDLRRWMAASRPAGQDPLLQFLRQALQ